MSATGSLAGGMTAELNKRYTWDQNNVFGSADAEIAPLFFLVEPPTLVLSSDVDVLSPPVAESGSNVVVHVSINDGIAAEQGVNVTVVCHVIQNGYDAVVNLFVPIAVGKTAGSLPFRVRRLGAYTCMIEGALLNANGTALLGPSRLQFAGPKKALDGSVAKISFYSVAATLTLTGGITNTAFVPRFVQTIVTLSSSILTDTTNEAVVRLMCAGQELLFTFEAGGVSSATAIFQYLSLEPTDATCTLKPFGITTKDQSFVDIKLAPVRFSIFVPVVTFTGLDNGVRLFAGNKRTLVIAVNQPVAGPAPLVARLTCGAASNFPETSFDFYIGANQFQATSPQTFHAPTLPVPSITCKFAYVSGDGRFKGMIDGLAPLTLSVADIQATVTRPAGPVIVSSLVPLTLTLSEAAQQQSGGGDLVFSVQCAAGSIQKFILPVTTLASTVSYPMPALPGAITCVFHYVSGDVRFENQEPANLVINVVTKESLIVHSSSSSASNGASSSSGEEGNVVAASSSGAGGGGNSLVVDGSTASPSQGLSSGGKAAVAVGVILGVAVVAGSIYLIVSAVLSASAATAATAAGGTAVGAGAVAAVGGAGGAVSAAAAAPAGVSIVVI